MSGSPVSSHYNRTQPHFAIAHRHRKLVDFWATREASSLLFYRLANGIGAKCVLTKLISLSQLARLLRRCATVTIVSLPDRFRNASISFASVAVSSALVASSRRSSDGR